MIIKTLKEQNYYLEYDRTDKEIEIKTHLFEEKGLKVVFDSVSELYLKQKFPSTILDLSGHVNTVYNMIIREASSNLFGVNCLSRRTWKYMNTYNSKRIGDSFSKDEIVIDDSLSNETLLVLVKPTVNYVVKDTDSDNGYYIDPNYLSYGIWFKLEN